MTRLRPIIIAIGVVAALVGLLWIGQGLNYVRWPAESFMIDRRVWADRGAALAVAGLVTILVARRLRR